MSEKYIPVRHDLPCPVCGSVKWCMIHRDGDKVICPKTKSREKYGEENYLHRVRGKQAEVLADMVSRVPVVQRANDVEWSKRQLLYLAKTRMDLLEKFASDMGVHKDAFVAYRTACCMYKGQSLLYTAMQDGENHAIGIQTRDLEGGKRMIKGSKQGIFTPSGVIPKKLYVCEGLADALALHSAGLYAIARVSAKTCYEQTAKFVRANPHIEDIVIVADNDESKAGLQGATRLGFVLMSQANVVVVTPEHFNDAREMWNAQEKIEFKTVITF